MAEECEPLSLSSWLCLADCMAVSLLCPSKDGLCNIKLLNCQYFRWSFNKSIEKGRFCPLYIVSTGPTHVLQFLVNLKEHVVLRKHLSEWAKVSPSSIRAADGDGCS